jgi:hypothetical protein
MTTRDSNITGRHVPEGQLKIAQRFNAEFDAPRSQVPKGRLSVSRAYQPSLRDLDNPAIHPALKRRAIFVTSLRDTHRIRDNTNGDSRPWLHPGHVRPESEAVFERTLTYPNLVGGMNVGPGKFAGGRASPSK